MTSYEATQERPNYWDGLPHDRRADDWGNGNWALSHTRVARKHDTLEAAERYARRILGQRPGVPVKIWRLADGTEALVAIVSRDALERTWTDVMHFEALL